MRDLEKILSEVPSSSQGFVTINYVENVHTSGEATTHIGNTTYLNSSDQDADNGRPKVINEKNAPYWIVPFDRNRDFVGRTSVLSTILAAIPPDADKDACQHTVIEGLGGIGKTQIALEAAFRLRESHEECSVFWVSALDAPSFENAYRDIGQRLKVKGITNPNADVKSIVKNALSETSIPWLLVIDNADDAGLLFGPETSLLADYLPSSRNGSILFTTRSHDVAMTLDIPRNHVITVAGMERSEAYQMLQTKALPEQIHDSEGTEKLLDFLADVPLAIKQAASYMERVGITATEYLDYCHTSDSRLIKLLTNNFADRTRYQSAQNPVATTWLISFQHISDTSPLAAKYLQYMSLLSEKDIPMTLLPPAREEPELREALQTLVSYSFIVKRPGQQSFDMHRLVRLVARNWLHQHDRAEAIYTTMVRHLCKKFKCPTREGQEGWREFLPHLINAVNSEIECRDERSLMLLCCDVAEGCYILGSYQQSEVVMRKGLGMSMSVLGKDNSDTIHTLGNLGSILECQGKYSEAVDVYEQVLAFQEKTTGQTSEATLRSTNNLSLCLRKSGKLKEAAQMQQQSLELHIKVLGKRNKSTLQAIQVMAGILDEQGKISEGAHLRQQASEMCEAVFGKEHTETLSSKHNFACSLLRLGRFEEAEKLLRDNLSGHERVFGKKHPDTLACLSAAVGALQGRGRLEEAKEMSWRVLGLQQEVLGEHHPITLRCMVQYADIISGLARLQEAEEIYYQAWSLQEKHLGSEHLDALETTQSLTRVLSQQGKHQEAEPVLRRTMALLGKTLGEEHPDTLAEMHFLADVLTQQGKHQEAESVSQQLLDLSTKAFGGEHPTTLSSMHSLADTIARQDRLEEADAIFRRTLDLRIKTLGREDASTLSTMHCVANAAARQGKLQEAKMIAQQTLDLRTKTLGEKHPRTQATASLLVRVLGQLEKPGDEAKGSGSNRPEPAAAVPTKQRRSLGIFRGLLKLR